MLIPGEPNVTEVQKTKKGLMEADGGVTECGLMPICKPVRSPGLSLFSYSWVHRSNRHIQTAQISSLICRVTAVMVGKTFPY